MAAQARGNNGTIDAGKGSRAGAMGVAGWMLFDWAAQPFYTLVITFLFGPYFVNYVVGDKVQGQAIWGYTIGAGALLVALGSPILGAMADVRGKVKPFMAILAVFFVGAQATLWYAMPASPHLWAVVLAVIVAMLAAEYSQVLSNSLMPRLVRPELIGRISGAGWAIGYFGGLASIALIVLVVPMPLDPAGKTLLGFEPLLRMNDTHDLERMVGPIAAVWFVLFSLPFFLFTPDATARAGNRAASLRDAFAKLAVTLVHVRNYRNIAVFFLARMVFVDGLQAIFQFGGIYAAAVFDWSVMALGMFAIILTAAGGVGALLGGFIDDRIGAKKVLIGALVICFVAALGVISIDRTHVLFWMEVAPRTNGSSLFSSTGEQVFVALAVLVGLASGPLQAASRSLLARMAPREHLSEFFGFFAFSGKITAFAAPTLIASITISYQSQRIGMSVVLVFLAIGMALMSMVNTRAASAQ